MPEHHGPPALDLHCCALCWGVVGDNVGSRWETMTICGTCWSDLNDLLPAKRFEYMLRIREIAAKEELSEAVRGAINELVAQLRQPPEN